MPSERQNIDVQAPAAQSTVEVRMVPCSVTTADTRPPVVSTPRTAQPVRTPPPRRATARAKAGDALCGSARPSVGVCTANVVPELVALDEPRPDIEVLREACPCGVALGLGVVVDQVEDAVLPEPDVLADLLSELPPDAERLDDHRHLAGVAALLANPAPVAAGLLAGDMPFLANHHGGALFREEPCGRDADDAAADDDHLGGRGYRCGRREFACPSLGHDVVWGGACHGVILSGRFVSAPRRPVHLPHPRE